MTERRVAIHNPEAGPSSLPGSRTASPNPDGDGIGTLQRPASHGRLSRLMVPNRSRRGSNASQQDSPITAYAEDGSVSSGRTTPEQRKRTGKAASASLLASDTKYKKYAAQVDKCLQAFESVNEWADFISFLSRLLKTLQSQSPPYAEVPRKLIVAKRLAQCLNPALPSGVHQRALDVYAQIFSLIGVEGLRRDLLIWSSGLFPFFQFAATSVRRILINIYQTYYLPLREDLRPATKALTLALLPGMEEETGDFFDKVLFLLSRVSEAVSPSFFLQNIFLVLISSPSSRLSALNYLSRRLLKPPDPESQLDVGLLIRGVAASLEDGNSLVRRGGLDLLLRILHLSEDLFRNAEEAEKRLLVRAVTGVVLQRELSLSRRVYTWLLGPADTSDKQIVYFREHGLSRLATTLEIDMTDFGLADPNDAQKPFKIFLSLLDRYEISSLLSERLAIPALEACKRMLDGESSMREEALMTASALYDGVEPIVIWRAFFRTVQEMENGFNGQQIGLMRWILSAIPQKDVEVTTLHAPVLLGYMLDRLTSRIYHREILPDALELCFLLLRAIPKTLFSTDGQPLLDTSELVATSLYSDQSVEVEGIYSQVAQQVIPGIVKKIFGVVHLDNGETLNSANLPSALNMAGYLIDSDASSISTLDRSAWIGGIVGRIHHISSFPQIDAVVVAILKASRCQLFSPPVDITSEKTIQTVLDSLFRFLRPDSAAYHVRAVELLWECNQLAEIHSLENVIARQVSTTLSKRSIEAIEAFGVLWRLTEDSMLPGEIFYTPMFIVLEGLKSPDPVQQGAAETWMHCNLRSYFRILDPILSRLLAPSSSSGDVGSGNRVDLSTVQYLVESITTLFRFGGTGLSKACQSTGLDRSSHPALSKMAEQGSLMYLELIVSILVRLLSSPLSSRVTAYEKSLQIRVQSSTLELLQMLVTQGDLAQHSLDMLKSALITNLALAVKEQQSTLQSKTLHLLHGAITTVPHFPAARGHRRSASSLEKGRSSNVSAVDEELDRKLVQIIIDGVASPANRPILQHWVDFVHMTAVQLQSRPVLLQTLCDCFSYQLKALMLELRNVYSKPQDTIKSNLSDAELVMIISGLERLATLASSIGGGGRRSEDGKSASEGGSGFLGLMSGVFVIENAPDDKSKVPESNSYLEHAVEALLVTWGITAPEAVNGSSGPSKTQTMARIRNRARKVLEKLFRTQPSSIVAASVKCWVVHSSDIEESAIFDCIDALAPSAQKVVEIISESVAGKPSKPATADAQSISASLGFLESYISRLEAPIAVQVWGTLFAFAKDMLAGATTPIAKAQLYPVLRCLTVLSQIVTTTSALEDRRLRRELQEVYPKVLDVVTTNASRIGEIMEMSRGEKRATNGVDETAELYSYLASSVVPSLRSFLNDSDRVAAACSTISSNIIMPAFRQQRAEMPILRILLEITKIPSATKTWRIATGDAFNDAKFFKARVDVVPLWKPLICALMDNDKERFGELLSRITAAPSSNIFTNREQEMIARSMNLRRMSFVLLAAERNHYLTQLPAIQEKLVDILRTNVVSPRVHSEVYLCLRILMCRISAQHLTNFWPVMLAELLRVFEAIIDEVPPDGSEALQLALAACKFLDLLLVIQSEDFQIQQWMFVTDTTDAACPPEDYAQEAIMDTIAEILAEHSHGAETGKSNVVLDLDESTTLRRPRLSNVKSISTLRQLQPFFSRASIDTFEGVYSNNGVDWATVEEGLSGEIFTNDE